jgi:hypothetical protein
VIKKLKNGIATAPVAHLFPLLVIEYMDNRKLKMVMTNCNIKLIAHTPTKLISIVLRKDLFPIIY